MIDYDENEAESRVFVFPGPRPEFILDSAGPNLYLAAPALNFYLLALAN